MTIRKSIFLLLFLCLKGKAQTFDVKVIRVEKIDCYYVYNVVNLSSTTQDTLIVLGCNSNNHDYKEVKLENGKRFRIQTRLLSRVKTATDEYLLCPPGVTVINSVQISKKSSLPIVILSAEILASDK